MVRGKNGKGYGLRPRGGASPCKTLLSTFLSGEYREKTTGQKCRTQAAETCRSVSS